jgi:hypothetical protein
MELQFTGMSPLLLRRAKKTDTALHGFNTAHPPIEVYLE